MTASRSWFGSVKSMVLSWSYAFRGFYNPSDGISSSDFGTRMLYSMRSVILVISVQAALISGLLGLIFHSFNALNFLLLLIAFIMLHAESNLLNDYFGFRYGHDTADSPRRKYTLHPIADGVAGKGELALMIFLMGIALLSIAYYFIMLRGIPALLLVIAGAVLLASYDVSPASLKTLGMGEFASFVVWGPLMISGGFYAIGGTINLSVLLASIPYGLGVMSVLIGKHIDQISFDAQRRIGTLPVRLGERASRFLLLLVIVSMYIAVAVPVAIQLLPFTLLVTFLNFRRLAEAVRTLKAERPVEAPSGFIGWPLWYHRQALYHNRLFGWLYIAGLLAYLGLTFSGLRLPFT